MASSPSFGLLGLTFKTSMRGIQLYDQDGQWKYLNSEERHVFLKPRWTP